MMTRERWQQIKDLFNSALSQPDAERSRFISDACEGDESLREEVESLISAHEEGDDFVDTPIHELAAQMLVDGRPELVAGQQVGPYTILSSLGAGGMGEVYLAQDIRLGRKVAVKLLMHEFARDQQRVRRFEQEARAASALNHPNVCVIHEIGKTEDGRHFMAMEYIDGATLRRRMGQKRLSWREALDVAAQVAWALEAAHAANIVHRDIKPENIMVRQDGYVKVLDFGIAKLNSHPLRQPEASTTAHLHTAPGTLMGTAKYMSPEQLRERPIDARTDIWSLGVVLCEMVLGRTPFDADTTNESIAIILERQPTELDFSAVDVPLDLQQIIRKALSKKRRDRYQTITEVASDLRRLRRHASLSATVEQSTDRLDQSGSILRAASGDLRGAPLGAPAVTIFSKIKSQAIWTADYVLSEIKQHKTAATFAGVTAVLALLFIGQSSLFKWKTPAFSLQKMKLTSLTNSGKSVCAAVSPDGQHVAHVERKYGMQELIDYGVVTQGSAVLVDAGDFDYRGLTFSRDSNYLYFTRADNSRPESSALYELTLPGGTPRKIKVGVDSPISFSPTGDRFAFVRENKGAAEYYLMIAGAGASDTDERILATRRDGDTISKYGPAWSPDGQTIVCSAGHWDHGYHENLTEVNVRDGTERVLGSEKWFSVLQVTWLEDKNELLISAADGAVSPYQLWSVFLPSGEATRITTDISQYKGVSVSRDAKTLVSVHSQQSAQVWVVPDGDNQRAREVAPTVGFTYGMTWTSKGKIVFSAMAGSNLNLFAINPDESNQVPLTSGAGDNYTPSASPNSPYVVFASNRGGSLNIWRMNADDGSNLKQLTFTDGNSYPSCSPNGQWVVYDNQSSNAFTVWKVPIDGGPPIQLSKEFARMPVVSPDGESVACRYRAASGSMEIAILPFEGGPPIDRAPIKIIEWQSVQWTKDGQGLTYIAVNSANPEEKPASTDGSKQTNKEANYGVANIWRYDRASGSVKQLTNFKTDRIFAYAWSPDQDQIACLRGTESQDVMIYEAQAP